MYDEIFTFSHFLEAVRKKLQQWSQSLCSEYMLPRRLSIMIKMMSMGIPHDNDFIALGSSKKW